MLHRVVAASVLLASSALGQSLPCEGWMPIPGHTNPYHRGEVYATAVFDFDGAGPEQEQLVVVGSDLRMIGAEAGNAYRWDGERWHSIGGGFDGSVYALHVYQGHLYAGGDFDVAGIRDAPMLARWENGAWAPVAAADRTMIRRPNAGSYVRCMTTFRNRLIIGGGLGLSGSSQNVNIVSWDGSNFHNLGSGTSGIVRTAATHRGDLIIGGLFTRVSGRSFNNLARWDGAAFHHVGPATNNQGVNNGVRALASYEDTLFIGGDFTSAGSAFSSRSFVGLNDQGWFRPAGGVDRGYVRALLPTSNGLIVGGTFELVNGTPNHGLALLRDGEWSLELGTVAMPQVQNFGPSIGSLMSWRDAVVLGGNFFAVGEVGAGSLAMKSPSGWTAANFISPGHSAATALFLSAASDAGTDGGGCPSRAGSAPQMSIRSSSGMTNCGPTASSDPPRTLPHRGLSPPPSSTAIHGLGLNHAPMFAPRDHASRSGAIAW
jgi:hypothetical protein